MRSNEIESSSLAWLTTQNYENIQELIIVAINKTKLGIPQTDVDQVMKQSHLATVKPDESITLNLPNKKCYLELIQRMNKASNNLFYDKVNLATAKANLTRLNSDTNKDYYATLHDQIIELETLLKKIQNNMEYQRKIAENNGTNSKVKIAENNGTNSKVEIDRIEAELKERKAKSQSYFNMMITANTLEKEAMLKHFQLQLRVLICYVAIRGYEKGQIDDPRYQEGMTILLQFNEEVKIRISSIPLLEQENKLAEESNPARYGKPATSELIASIAQIRQELDNRAESIIQMREWYRQNQARATHPMAMPVEFENKHQYEYYLAQHFPKSQSDQQTLSPDTNKRSKSA